PVVPSRRPVLPGAMRRARPMVAILVPSGCGRQRTASTCLHADVSHERWRRSTTPLSGSEAPAGPGTLGWLLLRARGDGATPKIGDGGRRVVVGGGDKAVIRKCVTAQRVQRRADLRRVRHRPDDWIGPSQCVVVVVVAFTVV